LKALVIGAGPSGSLSALLLLNKGLDVTILEKESFPREKPCAGGLTNKAYSLLEEIGLNPPYEKEINSFSFYWRTNLIREFETRYPVYTVKRSDFDYYLLKEARKDGVNLFSHRDWKLSRVGKKFLLRTEDEKEEFDLVIGADGATGNSAKLLGIRDKWRKKDLISTISYEGELDLSNREESIGIYFGYAKFGYSWIFPKQKVYSIGIGAYLPESSDLGISFQDFLAENEINVSASEWVGHPIPLFRIRRFCCENSFLVGDSAGLGNPLTGEGIYQALRSAQILTESDFSCSDYQKKIVSEFSRMYLRMGISYIFHKFFPKVQIKIWAKLLHKYLEGEIG